MAKQPISLAEVIGGNANGPRMVRSGPPREEYLGHPYNNRRDHGPNHPVFGRSAVAMPGMINSKQLSGSSIMQHEKSIPGIAGHSVEYIEKSTSSSTQSQPQRPMQERIFISEGTHPKTAQSTETSRSQTPFSRPRAKSITPTAGTFGSTQNFPGSAPANILSHSSFPQQSTSPESLTPSRKAVSRSQQSALPEFLRPSSGSAKEVSPSISRLQGRGFVQRIVQASEAGRQESTFDTRSRSSQSPLPSAPPRLYTTPLKQVDDMVSHAESHDMSRYVRSVASMPAISKTPPRPPSQQDVKRNKKPGSACTTVTFIEPPKVKHSSPVPGVSELGVRATGDIGAGTVLTHRQLSGDRMPRVDAVQALPSSPGKTLSHVRVLW